MTGVKAKIIIGSFVLRLSLNIEGYAYCSLPFHREFSATGAAVILFQLHSYSGNTFCVENSSFEYI